MNAYDLMEILGETDDAMLLACEDYTAMLARRRKMIVRTAAGICAVLALSVGIRMLPVFDRTEDGALTTSAVTEAVVQTQNSAVDFAPVDTVTDPSFTYSKTMDDAVVTVDLTKDDEASEDIVFPSVEEVPQPEADDAENAASGETAPKKDTAEEVEEEAEWEDVIEEDAPVEEPPAADEAGDIPASDDASDKVLSVESESSVRLPVIPLEEIRDAFGFEGILLYADDVYCNFNLLDQYGTPETLPVYKNLAFYDLSGKPVYLSDDVMLAQGQNYADLLGFEVLSYETGYTWDEEDIPGDVVILQTTGGEIRVQGNGFTTVEFAEPIALSGNRRLNGEISNKAAEKTTAYLWEQYSMLLDGQYGQYSLTCHRSFNGEPHRDFDVFTVSDDVQQNYFNASFASLHFFPGESDDTLGGIHIRRQAGALEKLGDYPLISEEEATEMLFAGEYITTVPAEYMTDEGFTADAILSCELEYRPSNLDTYYIPYYHYYVRLDNFPGHNMAAGLEHYGGYWVPAVQPEYLDTSMVTDGRFN